MYLSIYNSKKGFTLAEVLVTLAIIGVVASLTIPSIINNTQKASLATAAKKNFSMLAQAVIMMKSENNGTLGGNCFVGDNQSVQALNCITPYLKIVKNCGTGTGCFYHNASASWSYPGVGSGAGGNYDPAIIFGKAQLSNGVSIAVQDYDGDCINNTGSGSLNNTCGTITFDANGLKGPNVVGRDLFVVYLTRSGEFVAGGHPNLTNASWGDNYSVSCNPADTNSRGYGCLGRILNEGKMNY